jgi:hypothetical protein
LERKRKIEEVIKMIYQFYRKRRNQANSPCPDEETLVCFSEGRLSRSESEGVEDHLISCSRCADVVSLFCRRLKEEREVPEFLIKRAKGLIKPSSLPNILEVILALKEKAFQILRASGDIIMDNEIVPLPVLRSRQITDFPEEARLIKEFEDLKITIHIQKRGKDRVRVNVNLVDKISLLPIGELRLTLIKDAEEIESYEAVAGNVAFDNLSFGRYIIEILRQGNKLGAINLEIK